MSFIQLGQLEVDLAKLRTFIVRAKKNCYAGEGEETRLADGSKCLVFQDGDFYYTDNYDGYYQAPGTELVRWQRADGQRIWQMSYSGGMLSPNFWNFAHETYEFLKKTLTQISPEKPFRGPEPGFREGDFEYFASTDTSECLWGENFTRFAGREKIEYKDTTVFSQDYVGGLVIPK
ncbi:MAG: DUF5680 domain-containing protein [Nanoarchaeota archaeon]